VDTEALLRVFSGCASQEIHRFFSTNACIGATAITCDVMAHYGRVAEPWQVCLRVDHDVCHLDVGCFPPSSESDMGGHLVVIVEDAFLVDSSFRQVRSACPRLRSPDVFVGRLQPHPPPLLELYAFATSFALISYRQRAISRDYRLLPDWGPSTEREAAAAAIVRRIDSYRTLSGVDTTKDTN